MPRPAGSRNATYEETRRRLAKAILARVFEPGVARLSLREMAASAAVSGPTLLHYFGSREGAIRAAFAQYHEESLPHIAAWAMEDAGPVRGSLEALLRRLAEVWTRFGAGKMQAFGLAVGLGHDELGPAYLVAVLEPILQAAEARIARHVASGEIARVDLRLAAIELMSPLVVVLLHQFELGGGGCRPLDLDAFIGNHLDTFLRAHATPE
jgi:AcrR family transcriptional regulator